jgi:glutathione S-transferase
MQLFVMPGACSLAPHIVAREAEVPFELLIVDRKTRQAGGRAFADVNPKGYVPALEIEPGKVLTENAAILQFLADSAPDKQLAPAAGTFERLRLQEWLHFVGTEVHKAFSPLFDPTLPADAKAWAAGRITKRVEWLNTELADRPFLTGDRFTVADAYLFVVLSWSKIVKVDLSPYPNVLAFLARVAERPAVQAALKAEGLA